MTVRLSGNIKYLVIGLLLLPGINNALFSQAKSLGGVINKYARVKSMGTDYVIIKDDEENAGQFADFEFSDGDTVMLIQMKGLMIDVPETGSFGNYQGPIGNPGQHEFLVVDSVESATKRIVFKRNILNTTFSPANGLQIVTVPTYHEAIVNSILTCAQWDSTKRTGGVLVSIIGKSLTLNADINVTGNGFLGGAKILSNGFCAEDLGMSKLAYTAASDSGGFKGESPVSRAFISASDKPPIYPKYAKGYGANFTGGGGSRGRFSGAGGGGNYGLGGGDGGRENLNCTVEYSGGIGGKELHSILVSQKVLFPGSGGGGPTYIAGGVASDGGRGGGMVIIICDSLVGNTKSILADGAQPSVRASGNASAGGGGGGGTVAIYTQSYSNLTIASRGGKGGDTDAAFGEGGGGGGGLITTSNPLNINVTSSVAGGSKGTRYGAAGGVTGTNGDPGSLVTTFTPYLNGFLFNSISSSVTKNLVDSICSDNNPPTITGTVPVGGAGPYSYTWQKGSTPSGPWSLIGGATSQNYSFPSAEADTFWIRRIVKDDGSMLTDTSKAVQINVTPAITGNLVGKDTTICNGQDPLNLIPLNSGPSNGNGRFEYQWLQNPDDLNWASSPNASGTSDLASFDPPALNATTYYQRKVTSGRCVKYSTSVKITVLPSITGNITDRTDSVICEGSLFTNLSATAPGGGSGAFAYLWQDSITSGTWQPASGANTASTHNPAESMFATVEHRFFRRVVLSGPDDVCKSFADPIMLTMWQAIENNIISAPQTICSGSAPAQLTGLTPTQGDHTYTYIWQDSSKSASWTARSTSGTPYGPPSLVDTTWYRRIVNSSVCSNTSNKIVVNVHDPITNNIIEADTTICNGGNPGWLRGKQPVGGNSIFGYQWYSSSDNFAANNDPITVSGALIKYDPPALSADKYYRREVISGMCNTLSNIIRVTVLPSITNNTITPDKSEVCFNTSPGLITGSPLSGGAGGTPTWSWQESQDGIAFTTIAGAASQNFDPPGNLSKQTWYRRIIKSGPADCCIDTSAIAAIDTLTLPTAVITSTTDTIICGGKEVRLRVHVTGAKNWTLVYNENSTQSTINNISASNFTISRTPTPVSAKSTFNYTITSLTDNNNCSAVASGMTGSRKADVYRVPVANAGPAESIVCGTAVTLAAVPSDGTGTWTFPAQVTSGNPSIPNAAVAVAEFTEPRVTYKFYWQEVNWTCSTKDSINVSFDREIVNINAGDDDSNFRSSDYVIQLHADPIQSYETGKWSLVEGEGFGELSDDEIVDPWVTGVALGVNKYKWTVVNGECKEEDIVTYIVSNLQVPQLVSPNGDMKNDTLKIKGLNFDTQIVELTILNGAGTQVFSTSNANGNGAWKDWTGKDTKGEELPEGTYYYLLKVSSPVKAPGLAPWKDSGFVILKRR